MNLLAAGAGADEGLDQMLARMLMERQVGQKDTALAEETRHNQATERLGQDQLASLTGERDALTKERTQMTADRQAAQAAEQRRQQEEEALLADPNTPEVLKNFIKARRVTPKGENMPWELFQTPGANVNQEKANYVTEDPEVAKALGVKIKEPFTVWMNPRTPGQGMKTLAGQDLTPYAAKLQPYEKPPQPFFMPIQTGDNYAMVDRRNPNAPAVPVKDKAGDVVPLATTGTTRTMMEGAQMLEPHVPQLASMATELEKRGLFGPILSRVRQLAQKYGSTLTDPNPDVSSKALQDLGADIARDPNLSQDRLVGQFATTLGLMATGTGRVHGGARGGGSPTMMEYFKGLISDSASLPMFLGKLDALDTFLKGYAKGPGGGAEAGKTDSSTDLYQQYLNRPRK